MVITLTEKYFAQIMIKTLKSQYFRCLFVTLSLTLLYIMVLLLMNKRQFSGWDALKKVDTLTSIQINFFQLLEKPIRLLKRYF